MNEWAAAAPSMLASFMASMVEFVEALTIVLAVGVVRGWRSALLGTGAALAVLVALVLALGPSLARIPLHVVQGVVGTLLLLFGLRWLRKAVLRAAGILALHDEAESFAKETDALRRRHDSRILRAFDSLAFATSFKIVMLEGIEVVFIVIAIAIGAGGRLLVPAAAGAALALLAVVLLGLWLHRPLANVPENALKFGVGVMLAAFGTFWVGEGIGIQWPGADWSLLALIGAFLIVALVLVPLCARSAARATRRPKAAAIQAEAAENARGPLATLWNGFIGLFIDDGLLAVGIVVWVMCGWLVNSGQGSLQTLTAGAVFAAGLAALLSFSALRRAWA